MVKTYSRERWKTLSFYRNAKGQQYAISNFGRLVCFTKKIDDGHLLRCSLQEGYPIWRYRKIKRNGVVAHKGYLLHRLVAGYFLPRPQRGEKVVIHFNYKKTDNRYTNLSWATIKEATVHAEGSPLVKKARKLRRLGHGAYSKLSENDVKKIKRLLKQNKTLKNIALLFHVSDMQIHRIKTGENWKHVKI